MKVQPPRRQRADWWLSLEGSVGSFLGVSQQSPRYGESGAVSPSLGGRLSLVGGWRWLSLRVGAGVYGVTGRQDAGVLVLRPYGLMGVAFLRGVVNLRLEAGLVAEFFRVTSNEGNSFQTRLGVRATFQVEWNFSSRWSLVFSPGGTFANTEIPFLRRGQLVFQADHWQIELMVGVRFKLL